MAPAAVGAASAANASANNGAGLTCLQKIARERSKMFESRMEAAKTNSPAQISHALYEVGGKYRCI